MTARSTIIQKSHMAVDMNAIACVVAGVIGSMVFTIIPFIVGVISDSGDFNTAQIGYIGSADMAGMFVAAALAAYWIRMVSWRLVGVIAAWVLVSANLLTALFSHDFLALMITRVLAGLGGGSLMAIGMAGLGHTRNPDRWFGIFITTQASLGAFSAWFIPRYAFSDGLTGLVYFMVAFGLAAMLFLKWLPSRAVVGQSKSSVSQKGSIKLAIVSLVAAFVFGGGTFAVWAYVERIGQTSGISLITVGDAIAASLLAALGGAALATLISGRCKRIWPITLVLVAQLIAFVLLMGSVAVWEFTIAVMLISFLWYFSVPFQLGITVGVDPTGRFVVLFLMSIKGAYAVAPAAASLFISGNNYEPVLIFGVAAAILAYLIYCPLALFASEAKVLPGGGAA